MRGFSALSYVACPHFRVRTVDETETVEFRQRPFGDRVGDAAEGYGCYHSAAVTRAPHGRVRARLTRSSLYMRSLAYKESKHTMIDISIIVLSRV